MLVYGTKATLWARLQVEEKERLKNDGVQAELERRERELSERVVVARPGPLMIPGVVMPTAQEIASHEITHLPPKPWCESCQRGRANDKPHAKLGEDSFHANTPTVFIDFFYHGVTGEESKNDSDVDDIEAVS